MKLQLDQQRTFRPPVTIRIDRLPGARRSPFRRRFSMSSASASCLPVCARRHGTNRGGRSDAVGTKCRSVALRKARFVSAQRDVYTKRHRDRRGNIIVLTAVLMVVMMGFVAFGVDGGYMGNTQSELRRAV